MMYVSLCVLYCILLYYANINIFMLQLAFFYKNKAHIVAIGIICQKEGFCMKTITTIRSESTRLQKRSLFFWKLFNLVLYLLKFFHFYQWVSNFSRFWRSCFWSLVICLHSNTIWISDQRVSVITFCTINFTLYFLSIFIPLTLSLSLSTPPPSP